MGRGELRPLRSTVQEFPDRRELCDPEDTTDGGHGSWIVKSLVNFCVGHVADRTDEHQGCVVGRSGKRPNGETEEPLGTTSHSL